MNSGASPSEANKWVTNPSVDLIELLSRRIVGQSAAMQSIVPYIRMHQAGLAPQGRPVGIFLLLGPTGTGKTKTVEALAEVLHGSERNIVRVDCGEFQMEHEVAKLIGAPPGYLGHRETQPVLTQKKLDAVTSPACDLSLVLFDEIEKAASSMTQLLLGILDKATLRLGDGTEVNFEKSLLFLTSNLGAREMMKEMRPDFGFQAGEQPASTVLAGKLESIGLAAVRKRFSPEFVNRIDLVITYQPLDAESLAAILDQQITELQRHVNTRLGERAFEIAVTPEAREFLLRKGTSVQYGARELKRTIHRHLTQPLAAMVAAGEIESGASVRVELAKDQESLSIQQVAGRGVVVAPKHPLVLTVDDSRILLKWLERILTDAGWKLLLAESVLQAREKVFEQSPDVALLDYMLPDGDGLTLGVELFKKMPHLQVIIMTGTELSTEEAAICQQYDFPVLRKPFLAEDVVSLAQARLLHGSALRAHAGL